MSKIDQLWTELEQDLAKLSSSAKKEGRLTRLATPDSSQRLSVGIEWPSKCRVLLFDAPQGSLPPRHTWPACQGLELSLEQDDAGKSLLLLRLRENRLEDVFSVLAEDLARKILVSKPEQAGNRVLACIARWQKFLSSARRGFSAESRRGLWGELWVLEKIVIQAIGIEAGVASWRGPFGSPQDFQHDGMALEIKTRAAKPPAKVRISSELQLYAEPWSNLFLGHLAIDEQDSAGESLPQRIGSIRAMLADSSMVEVFEDALAEVGWTESDSAPHTGRGFLLREVEWFRVVPNFPCLIPSILPLGIGAVTYDLSIDAIREFAIAQSDVVSSLTILPEA